MRLIKLAIYALLGYVAYEFLQGMMMEAAETDHNSNRAPRSGGRDASGRRSGGVRAGQ